jgi:hypothetical protein
MAKSAQPGALMRRQKVVNEITSTAAQVFNWGVDDQRPMIRVGVINSASVRALPSSLAEAPVIDVTTSPSDAAGSLGRPCANWTRQCRPHGI